MTAEVWKYFPTQESLPATLSDRLNRPEGSEYPGNLPLENVVDELFPDRSAMWKSGVLTTLRYTFGCLCEQIGVQVGQRTSDGAMNAVFADLQGSIARRIFGGTSKEFNIASDVLQKVALQIPQDATDPIRRALLSFQHGPNDFDIRVPFIPIECVRPEINLDEYPPQCLSIAQLEKVMRTRLDGVISKDSIRIFKDVTPGMDVLQISTEPTSDEPPFVEHIAPYPMDDQIGYEFRYGLHQTDKKLFSFALGINVDSSDPQETPDHWNFNVLPEVTWPCAPKAYMISHEEAKRRLHGPSRIAEPVYHSLIHALYSGLSLIRHEILWPSFDPEMPILESTINNYRQALISCANNVIQHGEKMPSMYRMEELIREGILLMTLDFERAFELMKTLGISDVMNIDLIEKDNPTQDDLRRAILEDPGLAIQYASAFDLSQMYKNHPLKTNQHQYT